MSALNALKNRNPLTESFTVQLEADLEGLGLRSIGSTAPQRQNVVVVRICSFIIANADQEYSHVLTLMSLNAHLCSSFANPNRLHLPLKTHQTAHIQITPREHPSKRVVLLHPSSPFVGNQLRRSRQISTLLLLLVICTAIPTRRVISPWEAAKQTDHDRAPTWTFRPNSAPAIGSTSHPTTRLHRHLTQQTHHTPWEERQTNRPRQSPNNHNHSSHS